MEIQSIKSDDPSSSSVSPVAEVEPEQAKSSTTSIEDLYKYFGILADAKEQAGEVRNQDVCTKPFGTFGELKLLKLLKKACGHLFESD